MPKKKSALNKKTATHNIHTQEPKVIEQQLGVWAHEATKESLDKICSFIIKTKDKELREYANIAYSEAQYLYYTPMNDEEERDLELAFLIHDQQEKVLKLICEADRLESSLKKKELEQEVYDTLLKKQSAEQKKAWQYRYMGDVLGVRDCVQALEEDIEYESEWLKQAQSMMKTTRYKNMPEDIFEHMHLDSENGAYWSDDMGFMGDDCCGENCPDCGVYETSNTDEKIHPKGNYREIMVEDIPF